MNLNSIASRRRFLQSTSIAVLAGAVGAAAADSPSPPKVNLKKAVKYHMIKAQGLSILEKFQLLKDLGFQGVEVHTRDKDSKKVDELVQARDKTGIQIHGVLNSSSPEIKAAIDLAKQLGATSVLVVAGKVSKEVSYDANYTEWSQRLKENAPYAEQQNIRLLVENVWNNFLLSPMEMARFIDEIDSPSVGVYFDLGNVVRWGYPEQWIRILGHRIGKLDIKEYSRALQKNEGLWKGFEVKIGDGDVDFPACLQALKEIGYSGWATAEVKGGERARLEEIALRMNQSLGLT